MAWQSVLYFLFWAGLFAVMMRFGCGAHVMGHSRRSKDTSAEHAGRIPGSGFQTEGIDPVCGMTVQLAKAKSAVFQGRPYYFCSTTCRDKFESSPAAYAKAQIIPSPDKEHRHGSCCS